VRHSLSWLTEASCSGVDLAPARLTGLLGVVGVASSSRVRLRLIGREAFEFGEGEPSDLSMLLLLLLLQFSICRLRDRGAAVGVLPVEAFLCFVSEL